MCEVRWVPCTAGTIRLASIPDKRPGTPSANRGHDAEPQKQTPHQKVLCRWSFQRHSPLERQDNRVRA